jgi:molybdate transport repressor ModE-like protein
MFGPHVPDLFALQLLAMVSEEGSLSSAGARLGISQQAASARMRSLEAQVGAILVTRSARGSSLTAAGVVITGWATEVIAAAERLDAGIASIRSETLRQLDVAASLTIAEYLLPRWLVALRNRQEAAGHVATQVGLTATNSDNVIELVRSGSVPLGFIETSALPADLRVKAIGFDELQLAVSLEHPWSRRRTPVTAQELARTPLVTREPGSGTRQTLEQLLIASGIANSRISPPRVELSSTAAVRTAIAAGTAPGVLSSLAIADDLALGRLAMVATTGIPLRRQLSAVWSNGAHPPHGPAQDLVAIAMRL